MLAHSLCHNRRQGNHRVAVFEHDERDDGADGVRLLLHVGKEGPRGLGAFRFPTGLCASDKYLFVADTNNCLVQARPNKNFV